MNVLDPADRDVASMVVVIVPEDVIPLTFKPLVRAVPEVQLVPLFTSKVLPV